MTDMLRDGTITKETYKGKLIKDNKKLNICLDRWKTPHMESIYVLSKQK